MRRRGSAERRQGFGGIGQSSADTFRGVNAEKKISDGAR
jgi:hypothetical protein